jgi:hypothetical protein
MASAYSLGVFAAVGLAIALSYLMLSTTCAGVLMLVRSRRAASAGLRHAPGAFIALEIKGIERRLRRQATAVLLFAASFGALVALGSRDEGAGRSLWVPAAIALLVVATGAFAAAKGIALNRYHRRLRSLLQTSRQVAQRLEEVQRRGHAVFHAVRVGDRAIDHVIVGPLGVFAAQLVMPPRAGATSVSMARGSLFFAPAHGEFRLQPATEAFACLAKELGRVVGHAVKVVPTLVAVGCRIATRDEDRYLLVNEQTCVTLVGWKDSSAFLMDDEITRICEWLATQCQREPGWAWRSPRGALHPCITRPEWW